MNSEIRYRFEGVPGPGECREVVPGLLWLRMPLPFKLDHINLWLVDEGSSWTIVDTGVATEEVQGLWEGLFAGPMAGRPVGRVISTHFHPDHMGLAGWLVERFGCEFWCTCGEWAFGRMLSLDDGERSLPWYREFYRRAGFGDDLLALVEARRNPYPKRVHPIPGSYRRIRDGEQFAMGGRAWRVMVGMGHAPEHACLYCPEAGVLISGDQILPRISPNVSVWPQEPEADPLRLFLDSLRTFAPLSPDTLVLPSHDAPFHGLHFRLDQLAHHHDERLEKTVAVCREPRSGLDVLRHLFHRELDDHQIFFAIGESLAHLHFLVGEARLERGRNDNGADLFRAVGVGEIG